MSGPVCAFQGTLVEIVLYRSCQHRLWRRGWTKGGALTHHRLGWELWHGTHSVRERLDELLVEVLELRIPRVG